MYLKDRNEETQSFDTEVNWESFKLILWTIVYLDDGVNFGTINNYTVFLIYRWTILRPVHLNLEPFNLSVSTRSDNVMSYYKYQPCRNPSW